MADTTQRALQLLGLLQARATWQAHELAAKLGVTERTVRRDITRLRDLGYPVHSSRGLDGGYQLGRFPSGWREWNDRYRDSVRDFWRSADGAVPENQ